MRALRQKAGFEWIPLDPDVEGKQEEPSNGLDGFLTVNFSRQGSLNPIQPMSAGRFSKAAGDLAEMVAEDCQFNGVPEVLRSAQQRTPKESPVGHATPMPDSKEPK